MIEAKVKGMGVSPGLFGNSVSVILTVEDSDNMLPILIGTAEAIAIDAMFSNNPPPRPLTHDLISTVIMAIGGSIIKIEITELRGTIFYAKIFLQKNDTILEIDARPSDAIALALRAKASIFIEEELFRFHSKPQEMFVKPPPDPGSRRRF